MIPEGAIPYVLLAGFAVAYLICLRLILGPRREVHPEFPFVGMVGLPALFMLSWHMLDTFHMDVKYLSWLGPLILATMIIVGKKHFSLFKRGFKRGILWLIKIAGIFLVVDFFLFYCTNIRLMGSSEPIWYSLIEEAGQKLGLDAVGYHIYMEDKSWWEWLIVLDCGLSVISFLEGIPSGLRLIQPRLPLLPTAIVMLCQLRTRKRRIYCPQCEKNLSYKELVHFCPVCQKISTIRLMNPLGTVWTECENELCNYGKRKKFSRINPLGKKAVQKNRIRCRACSSLLTLGNAFVTLSLFADSPSLVRDFRFAFCNTVLNPRELQLADPEGKRIACKLAPDMANLLTGICDNGNTKAHIPLSPLRISLSYEKNKSLDHAVVGFRAAIKDKDSNRLTNSEGIILLLDGSARATERQAAAESLAVELERLNTEGGAWKEPVLVALCADRCDALKEVIANGFADYAAMEQACMEFLEAQGNDEIVSLLGSAAANVRYLIYRTGTPGSTENTDYNIVPPVQALLYRRLPALRKHWQPSANGLLPAVTGKYSAK